MTSNNLTLYHSRGSSSRVALINLEQTGAPYTLLPIATHSGEARTESFRRINPKGQVPVLMHNGTPITENLAIAFHLSALYPDAVLLPKPSQHAELVEALSLMSWCATVLHALIGRMLAPRRITDDEQAQPRVKEMASNELALQLGFVAEPRLERGPWLLGDACCAADTYLFWVCVRASKLGCDLSRFPQVTSHVARMFEQPAVRCALAREAQE